ncbi:MAG: hypothetical protein KHX03_00550 [Clostridium sp.]|nr:hypothetical protein [Clostridium sp.]
MSNKRVLKLRQSILTLNTQLLKLKDKLDISEENNIKYNKILIKKAILKKELDESKNTILQKFFKKFSHKGEKLICDYFKS